LLIGAAGLYVVGAVLELAGVPSSGWAVYRTAVLILASAGYLLGAVGAAGLLVSRLSDSRFQATTTPASLFNLVLLLAVFASGGLALFASDHFAAKTTAFVTAVLTANASVEISAVLALHLVLVLVFLAYLPFSQMMHFVAKYFTYHEVRWDDEPSTPGGRLEREVTQLLKQPVTWSGPHLNADGEKNWVDLATEETEK
jgi:nitrate reductase gamma subunit